MTVEFVVPRLDRLAEHAGASLCAFAFAERRPFAGAPGLVDWRLHGHLSRLRISGFLTGALGEATLIPLGGKMELARLVLLGLGDRNTFDSEGGRRALTKMFEIVARLSDAPLVVSLPGRPEGLADPAEALDLFFDVYHAHGRNRPIAIVEPSPVQKLLAQIVDRRRLMASFPGESVRDGL